MKKTTLLLMFILLVSTLFADIDCWQRLIIKHKWTNGFTTQSGEFSANALYSNFDAIYIQTTTIASAASVTIDLESLIDFQGNSFAFEKIKLIAIKNASGSALSCSGDWLNGETISEHDTILKSSPQAGYSVLSGSGKLILNSANLSICDIIIVGTKQ